MSEHVVQAWVERQPRVEQPLDLGPRVGRGLAEAHARPARTRREQRVERPLEARGEPVDQLARLP